MAKRPHEPEFRWFERLRGTGVFLDVGANSGQSALSFRMFNKTIPIVSVEANPACEADLKLVRRLIPRFDYRMVALGAAPGTVTLSIPVAGNVPISQAASLDPGFIAARGAQIEERTGGATATVNVDVRMTTVDALDLHVGAMKIDVEGTELAVLEGARDTIERQRPVVMIEVLNGSGSAVAHLRGLGYSLHQYDPATGRLAPLDATTALNAIALPPEWAA